MPEPMKKGKSHGALQRGTKCHAELALPLDFTAEGQLGHPSSWVSIHSPATLRGDTEGEEGKTSIPHMLLAPLQGMSHP